MFCSVTKNKIFVLTKHWNMPSILEIASKLRRGDSLLFFTETYLRFPSCELGKMLTTGMFTNSFYIFLLKQDLLCETSWSVIFKILVCLSYLQIIMLDMWGEGNILQQYDMGFWIFLNNTFLISSSYLYESEILQRNLCYCNKDISLFSQHRLNSHMCFLIRIPGKLKLSIKFSFLELRIWRLFQLHKKI